MRNYKLQEILAETKYARRYIIKMIQYFFKYGVYKEDIIKRISHLYRGLDKDFVLADEYIEDGFMSTSWDMLVAKKFAGQSDGNMLIFNTKKLPSDTPFVIIDETIDENLFENEVLFLPGKIKLKKTPKGIKALYTMNPILHEINKMPVKSSGGGELIPKIELKGKYIVWWRAILGRPVEIVGTMELPKKSVEVEQFFMKSVLPHDDKFEMKTNFIPQYMDLKRKFIGDEGIITQEDRELYKSYSVHMAVYDAKKREVLTLHYGVFIEMFNGEMFNSGRAKEVIIAIKKHCEWLSI